MIVLRHRAKYIKNSYNGDGTLLLGNVYQSPIKSQLIGAGGPQEIYEVSTIQRYGLGTRVVTPDGRVFRYGLSAAAIQAGRGCKTIGSMASHGVATTCTIARIVGDDTISFAAQTFAKDVLVGGYIVIYSAASTYQQRLIVGNNACSGTTLNIELEYPLTVAVAAATYCEVMGNPYRYMSSAATSYASCLGVPHVVIAAAGTYFWMQTWGPLWCNPGPYGMGGDAQERHVIFNPDGSLRPRNEHAGDGVDYQLAGFIMNLTGVGADAPPFIMLQISP